MTNLLKVPVISFFGDGSRLTGCGPRGLHYLVVIVTTPNWHSGQNRAFAFRQLGQ